MDFLVIYHRAYGGALCEDQYDALGCTLGVLLDAEPPDVVYIRFYDLCFPARAAAPSRLRANHPHRWRR